MDRPTRRKRSGGSTLQHPVAEPTKHQRRYQRRKAQDAKARAEVDTKAARRLAEGLDLRGRTPEQQREALVAALQQATDEVRQGVSLVTAWRNAATEHGNYEAVQRAVRVALGKAQEVREDTRHAEAILSAAMKAAGGVPKRRGGPHVSTTPPSPEEVERRRALVAAAKKGGRHE